MIWRECIYYSDYKGEKLQKSTTNWILCVQNLVRNLGKWENNGSWRNFAMKMNDILQRRWRNCKKDEEFVLIFLLLDLTFLIIFYIFYRFILIILFSFPFLFLVFSFYLFFFCFIFSFCSFYFPLLFFF